MNVFTDFMSKFLADEASKSIPKFEKTRWEDALKDLPLLYETNQDDDTTASDLKFCLVKSNSHPSINKGISNTMLNTETVVDETKVPIKLDDKSIDQWIDKLSDLKSIEQPPAAPQKKLLRGISRATDNIHLVSKVRGNFALDFQTYKDNDSNNGKIDLDLPDHSFTLPDISIHPDDFRQFLEKDLIEKSTLSALKSANRLNWWSDELNIAQKLWPLATTGDGNCLLHACSLGLWGFHDRLLTLRKALHHYLINSPNVDTFYKRWRWQCSLENKKAGLILSEEEWTNDWQSLLKMASTEPRLIGSNFVKTNKTIELNGGLRKKDLCEEEFTNHVYESLEEIHILALAHVLKRPIVVIADIVLRDVKNEPFAPIPFGGIYLPLECDPNECKRTPLCMTYDAAHFSSLVAMDQETYVDMKEDSDRNPLPPAAIPLVDFEGKLLPVQFVVKPPIDLNWTKLDEDDEETINKFSVSEFNKLALLDKYLDLVYIDKNTKSMMTSEEFKIKNKKEEEKKFEVDNIKITFKDKSSTLQPNSTKLLNSKNLSSSIQLAPAKTCSSKHLNVPNSENERKKRLSFNLGSLSSLSQKFSNLTRSFSKRLKRNITSVNTNVSNLARRSSFRLSRRKSKLNKSESLTKSTSNLDTAIKTNSLSPSPIQHKSSTIDRSPTKLSTKSSSTKSIHSQCSVQQKHLKTEERVIPNNLVLAANLHIHNLPSYRDEFIRNYLNTARLRFLNECESRSTIEKSFHNKANNSSDYSSHNTASSNTSLNSTSSNFKEDYAPCVNTGCLNIGKSSSSYLCEGCHTLQKKELIELRTNTESIY